MDKTARRELIKNSFMESAAKSYGDQSKNEREAAIVGAMCDEVFDLIDSIHAIADALAK